MDDLVPHFRQQQYEMKKYLKTIVVPIGQLQVGLCRHRAILFKVGAGMRAPGLRSFGDRRGVVCAYWYENVVQAHVEEQETNPNFVLQSCGYEQRFKSVCEVWVQQ